MGDWEDWHANDAQADRSYWNNQPIHIPECELHGDTQYFNHDADAWECYDCIDEEDMQNG